MNSMLTTVTLLYWQSKTLVSLNVNQILYSLEISLYGCEKLEYY